MKTLSLTFLFSFAFSFYGLAQNLVPNPSFEQLICEDEEIAFSFGARDWSNCGWVQFYAEKICSELNPNIYQARRNAHLGKCYASLYLYRPNIGLRNFLKTKLKEALIKNEDYVLGFYIMLAPGSLAAVKNIGFNFSDLEMPCEGIYDFTNPSVEYKPDYYLTDSMNWMFVSLQYKAKGGEQYMTIGRFTRNYISDSTQATILPHSKEDEKNYYSLITQKGKTTAAYYFIDDVSVTLAKNNSPDISKTSLEKGKSITLNNLFFETDKSELLPASFAELDKLTEIMKSNLSLIIVIRGHTDNSGTEEHNQQLSLDRANEVMNYLVKKRGISQTRLSTWGFGSSRPLVSNITEEGKAMNRRVEILVK